MLDTKTQSRLLILLVLLHLAVALPLAYFLNIWVDEASTLYATQNGLAVAFQTAAAEQKQAPLYFWILSLWRHIDGSIFFARLFSIICSVAAIVAFYGLAKRLFQPKTAMVITAFIALHPFLFWASTEIRVYSMVVMLSIILIRLFYEAFWVGEPGSQTTASKVWFLAVVVVSLYTNYYLGFVIAGLGISLVISGRWSAVRSFAIAMLVAGIAFIPMLLEMRAEFAAKSGGFLGEQTSVEALQIIWNNVLTFVLPTEIFPGNEPSVASTVRSWIIRAVFAAILIAAVMRRKQLRSNTLLLGVVVFTTIVFLFAAYFAIGASYIVIRHASILFAPLILFLAMMIADITRDLSWMRSKVIAYGIALLVGASFVYGTLNIYPNFTKRGDWARVGEFIHQNESPGQPIIVFVTFEALALQYNYAGVNKILPDERYFEYGLEASTGSPDSRKREIDFVISELPRDAEQIWLAVGDRCITSQGCLPLQNYISANYTIEIEKDFSHEKLYLLRKKSK